MWSTTKYVVISFLLFTIIVNAKKSSKWNDDSITETMQSGNCKNPYVPSEDIEATKCKPRMKIVAVQSSSPSYNMFPQAVQVMRCDGMCSRSSAKSCLPTQKKRVKKNVFWRYVFSMGKNSMNKCGFVELDEHVKCSCQCKIMESDCSEYQYYNKDRCMCECKDKESMNKCYDSGQSWDHGKCKCNCREELACTTGTLWVPDLCACAKVMQNEDESRGSSDEGTVQDISSSSN